MSSTLAALAVLASGSARAEPLAEQRDEGETIEVSANLPWNRRPSSRPIETEDPVGAYRMSGGDLERLPGAAADPARALQALPGVHAANLRTTALSVRGGGPAETLWVVDGVPLPSPRSSGGILSQIDTSLLDHLVLHAGAQPAEVQGSLGGAVHATLLRPSDDLTELSAELGPYLGRALVSAPLGPKGRGNGLWVAARRTLLEPSLWALSRVDAMPEQTIRVQDLAARVQLQPHPDHAVLVTAIAGESLFRSDEPPSGMDLLPQDRVGALLLSAHHHAELGEQLRLRHLVAWTRELQRVDLAAEDRRRDVRDRVAARLDGVVAPDGPVGLRFGAEVAHFRLQAQGRYQDPRTAPPSLPVPWRRMDPPTVDARGTRRWGELSGWIEAPVRVGRVEARPGARLTSLREAQEAHLLPEPRLALRYEGPKATLVQAQGALLHAWARDPLALVGPGAGPLTPARVAQADLSLQQGVGEGSALRLDAWSRWLDRLPVWAGPAQPTEPLGSGRAHGVDLRVISRAKDRYLVVGGGLQRVERGGPFAPFDGDRLETGWAVPWSLTAQAGLTTPGRIPFELGASILLRSGLAQIPLDWEVREQEVIFLPRYGERRRLGPRGRLGLRGERQIAVAGTVDLSIYTDLIVPFGHLNATLSGGEVDPLTGAVTPPQPVTIRDLPLIPWIGVRARR